MENLDPQLQKKELIENLEKTKAIIKRNVSADAKLFSIKFEIQKTYASKLFLGLAFIASYLTLGVSMGLASSHDIIKEDTMLYFLLLAIGFVVLIFIVIRRLGKKLEKKLIKQRFKKRESEINELNNIIIQSFEECELTSILPEKYWNLQAIDKIISYFINKRADSLKEAINLFEDESIKSKHMNMLNSISQNQISMMQNQRATKNQLLLQGFMIALKK